MFFILKIPAEETMLPGGCVKTMNIQYHVITVAAHIEPLGKTNSAFIQLHLNELADT